MSSNRSHPADGIAIIGMACRFPGAQNVDEFWRNLRDGVESISFFSDEELAAHGISSALLADPDYVKAGAVLEGVQLFDAGFFGYSPREAELIDPQQRLFLESAWTALEVAGYSPESYRGQIGVYAGSRVNDYFLNHLYPDGERFGLRNRIQPLALGDDDYLATRVSHKLNLSGPSVKVQAACSTSLVAVHLACQALLNGECDMALAGGVALRLPEKAGYLYQQGSVASPDGHCRAFDARGQGTIFGNGVGVVVLKRLADAMEEGDHIEAIIRGSAVNNDGGLKVGFAAPSADGQARVVAEALDIAGVDPETVTFIEAHGTATPLGDRIEIEALNRVFSAATPKRNFCAIASVKSNIGHASAAAGVAGLIKTTLALKHRSLPPSLHFERPNPDVDLANSPFFVNKELTKWNSVGEPRRAGVSAFGVGGTNSHVVLEEAPVVETSGSSRAAHLLLLSAKTATALETASGCLAEFLKQHPDIDFADAVFTLQIGRRALNYRRALVCSGRADAIQAFDSADPKRILTSAGSLQGDGIAFMFPGQGSQYINMGRDLYEGEALFRAEVDRCAETLTPMLGLDLRPILYPKADFVEAESTRLRRTLIAQPALFTVEYALARLLISWGLKPKAMIGHSVGEYVAACLAGVFSLEDGLALIAGRGRLMDELPGGAMLAVALGLEEVKPLVSESIALAADNGPRLCVLSGTHEAIEELERRLSERDIDCRRLHTSHAFHSQMMEPARQKFTEEVRKIKLAPPAIPYLSNVSGRWITAAEATDASYWAQQLRGTVRFAEGLSELQENFNAILLEIGPGQSLSAIAKQNKRTGVVLSTMRHPQENKSDLDCLLTALARLWLAGVSPDWTAFHAGEKRHRVPLPTYPFERQRYWVDAPGSSNAQARPLELEKLPDIADWFYVPSWKRSAPPQMMIEERHRSTKSRSWLIFLDGCGLGARLAKRLEVLGDQVVQVTAGEKFGRIDKFRYAVDPRKRSDYFQLIESLAEEWSVPSRVAHLWSVTVGASATAAASFDAAQHLGFYSLLYLAQALAHHRVVAPLHIYFCTNDSQDVGGEVRLRPEKATALGPCRVIPQEFANISCSSIDIVLPNATENFAELVEQLTRELMSTAADSVIAYRGRHRWVQGFERVRLASDLDNPPLRPGGVYLITGGLGHIGLLLGLYLARSAKAKVVLTGRSALPGREEWEGYLRSHEDNDPLTQRIRRIREMEDFGAEVLTISADTGSLEQMRAVIAQATLQFGSFNGVIHAAGILGEKLLMPVQEVRTEQCADHFRAKCRGLMVLDELLQSTDLDFCIATSSLSSVVGGLGYSAYAASNLFMDAFANNHSQAGRLPWRSINFGRWHFGEDAVGQEALSASAVRSAMTPEEGVESFRRVLGANAAPQVIVSTRDLAARLTQWNTSQPVSDTGSLFSMGRTPSGAASSTYSRPEMPNPYVVPRTAAERTIATIWEQLLGIGRIGIHDHFFDLGGHSLLATRMISRIREAFNIDVSMRVIFDAQTVAELAGLVEKQSPETRDVDSV